MTEWDELDPKPDSSVWSTVPQDTAVFFLGLRERSQSFKVPSSPLDFKRP